MLKDLKTSAVKRCSFAKLTLCRSASHSLSPPKHSPLSEILSTGSYCSMPQTHD